MSKDKDEQIKLAHKVIDIGDQSKRKIHVTLLRYNVEKPESSHAQTRLIAKKEEEEKFQQIFYVNYKLEKFIYILDVMDSVYDKVNTNKPICNVVWKIIAT